MPGPIETVLDRLAAHYLRPAGRNRWRARCPAHGGKNRSTLSIGIGADDAVLLRCWHGCEVDAIAQALGLELAELFPPRLEAGQGARQGDCMKPRRVGSARKVGLPNPTSLPRCRWTRLNKPALAT
ncbi:MAG: hypothetical protein RLY71_3786 [Pseudomonadota bacterium]|jgi:hypothetical protein